MSPSRMVSSHSVVWDCIHRIIIIMLKWRESVLKTHLF